MKKNNAGMSIVEVIVVVAMIAILVGTGAYGIGQLGGFRAREGADKVASSLTEARITMLGKAKSNAGIAWEIRCEDGEYFVRTVYDAGGSESYGSEKKIVDGKVTVTVGNGTLNTANNSVSVSSSRTINNGENERIYFNRSTGALCDSSGAEVTADRYIRVTQGDKNYDVFVVAKTGKIITQSIKK